MKITKLTGKLATNGAAVAEMMLDGVKGTYYDKTGVVPVELEEGADLEAEVNAKGYVTFYGLTGLRKPVTDLPAPAPKAKASGGGFRPKTPEQEACIIRQACIKAAVVLATDADDAIRISEKFYNYVTSGGAPTKAPDPVPTRPYKGQVRKPAKVDYSEDSEF